MVQAFYNIRTLLLHLNPSPHLILSLISSDEELLCPCGGHSEGAGALQAVPLVWQQLHVDGHAPGEGRPRRAI